MGSNDNVSKSYKYTQPCLQDYDVSLEYGFLLPKPLNSLPDYFSEWNEIAHDLPELIMTKKIRDAIDKMVLLDHKNLTGDKEYRCAYLFLSLMSQAYVWLEGDKGVKKVLPKQLAIPFCAVAKHLGLPPVICHASLVLANWKLRDSDSPFDLSNLLAIVTVSPTDACSWFALTTALVEYSFVPALKAMLDAFDGVVNSDKDTIMQSLVTVEKTIQNMQEAVAKMHEQLTADTFYNSIRPYLTGWGGEGSPLPEGLIYEGVSASPQKFCGGSAAQSSTVQSLDAFLGVQHSKDRQEFLHKMRMYMPLKHVKFIEELENSPSIKEYVHYNNDLDLQMAYNRAVEALENFRSYHIQIVAKYIVMQTRSQEVKDYESIAEKGTGGTSIMPFLKGLRDTTREHKLMKNHAL